MKMLVFIAVRPFSRTSRPIDLHAVEVGDRGLEIGRMVDAPGRAVRPVDPDAVTHLAAQKLVAGHAQRLGLGVQKRVLDGAQRQGNDAARGRPRDRIELGVEALVLADGWPIRRDDSFSIAVPTPGRRSLRRTRSSRRCRPRWSILTK
jgi:hypothetical protein